MKYTPFIAPVLVLLVIFFNQTVAESPQQVISSKDKDLIIAEEKIFTLAKACHTKWQSLGWKIGQQNTLAKANPAFNDGIKNICRARAELFFEGYELTPFIAPDSQSQVFPIVFRYDVEEIKAQIRIHLPKLRLI
jgi:hypothetical protein